MKKFVLLCTILAALCCMVYAQDMSKLTYDDAKNLYAELTEKVITGTATVQEAVQLQDLSQMYGWTLPEAVQELEVIDNHEAPGSTDQGSSTCEGAPVIEECPFTDVGNLDGTNDCALSSPSISNPINDIFFEFHPPLAGINRYQFRLWLNGSTSSNIPYIRIVKTACCASNTVSRFAVGTAVGSDCPSPAGGLEVSYSATYAHGKLSSDTVYWIHIGTTGSLAQTYPYQFDVMCVPSPLDVSGIFHGTCETAITIACNDSIYSDSAYTTAPATPEWYRIVIEEPESLIVWAGAREMGHYLSGLYPYGGNAYEGYPVDARFTIYRERLEQPCVLDSITYSSDGNVPYSTCQYDAMTGFCALPGTYYIRVWNTSNYPYILTTRCVPGCEPPQAACCKPDGCENMAQFDCWDAGGIWRSGLVCGEDSICKRGDFCFDPIVVDALPFVDADKTTCGFADNYRVTAMGSYTNGPDVIYTIELDGNTCFACSLFATPGTGTGSSPYGSVSLYSACPNYTGITPIAKSTAAGTGPYGFVCQGIDGPLAAGTYYIMVDNYAPGPDCINYTLRVFECDCPNPCPYSNRDTEPANNACATATDEIPCGEYLCGTISATSDVDWYMFTIPTGPCDSVYIDVYANDTQGMWPYGTGLDPYVYLYKADCATMIGSNDDNNGTAPAPVADDSRLRTLLFPGAYYIKVAAASSTYGPYVLYVNCFEADCPDTTGDNCDNPRVIPSLPYTNAGTTMGFANDYNPTTCLGTYYGTGRDVIYQLTLDGNTCFKCTLATSSGSYASISLWDACPTTSGACLAYDNSSPYLINMCGNKLPAGVYYILLDNWPTPDYYTYTLQVIPCDCPVPCESYTLCGSPAEVESNNTCPPPVEQTGITCGATVYGLHCPAIDTDFWKVTVAPMSVMTIKVYTGAACDVNPAVGVLFRYYNDLCASPTTGVATSVSISNTTTEPLVKYLEVYDSGTSQTLYKVEAACCQVTDYCDNPMIIHNGPFTFSDTVNTCCATRAVDSVRGTDCATGTWFKSGPCVMFYFTLSTTGLLDITVGGITTTDVQFMVFTDCENPTTTCWASRDAGTPEVINDLSLPAGGYYLAVMFYDGSAPFENCGSIYVNIVSDVPLPVNLLGDVVATPGNEKVTLSWSTASETENARFEIVRNDHVIDQVEGAGTSTTRRNYVWTEENLSNNTTYTYTLRSVNINEYAEELATVEATPSFAAGEVTEYALHQNYPNPFNPTTSIAFDLLASGNVTLKIYNLMGQEVKTVVNGMVPQGRHIISFNAGDLASGIYLYRIEVNGFVSEKKMLLMK